MPTNIAAPIRARRFPLRLPLRYRVAGEKRWSNGITDNVSCSGVLLRGRKLLPPSSTIEILLSVPRQLAGEARVRVFCRGQIARVEPRRFPLFPSTFGIKVIDYELIESPADMARDPETHPDTAWLTEFTHELNNMLAVVIGSSELILSDPNAARPVRQQMEHIHNAAQRSASLVKQMMSRGQYEAKRPDKKAN
jgi:signal transduction histidine kinase